MDCAGHVKHIGNKDCIMAEINDSAESRQVLNDLKGRMLALKEHL